MYLGLINEAPSTLIGHTKLQAKNVAELRKWIATDPTKVNLTHADIGSASQGCGLMLQSALKADMTTVPYRRTGPAMTDLMGGRVDLMCEQATNAVPQIEGGKLNGFAVTSKERIKRQKAPGITVVSDARRARTHKRFVETEVAMWAKVIQAACAYADRDAARSTSTFAMVHGCPPPGLRVFETRQRPGALANAVHSCADAAARTPSRRVPTPACRPCSWPSRTRPPPA